MLFQEKQSKADGLTDAVVTPAEQQSSSWLLEMRGEGNSTLHVYPIGSFPFHIGRRSNASLSIANPTVSGAHAEIHNLEGTLYIRDLGSTNGSFVNGKQINGDATSLKEGDLIQLGRVVLRLKRRQDLNLRTLVDDVCEHAYALTQFDRLMTERAVVPFFQPIVDREGWKVVAYEVLGRSRLPGLESPYLMFKAAAQLDQESPLSRLLRVVGLEHGMQLPNAPHLFLNTHPDEMKDIPTLMASLHELRKLSDDQEITLEIHEGVVAQHTEMRDLRRALNGLGIGLAYDDFGAGQARLVELVDVPPDCLKFDMKLVQGIHAAPSEKISMLASLVQITRELGVIPLAEGVECEDDSIVLEQLGFELFQGYYFGRPAAGSEVKKKSTKTEPHLQG